MPVAGARALADLERITDLLSQHGAHAQLEALDLSDEAIGVLARHPLIGRQVESALRALVISPGRTGYITLYSYETRHAAVLIRAIRH
jgi:plasmid stabilization system protein ParE